MKSISEYLVHIRTAVIKSDIKIMLWRLYTASLILFLVGLMLENVFYLSPIIRYTSLMVMGSLLLVIGFNIETNPPDCKQISTLYSLLNK